MPQSCEDASNTVLVDATREMIESTRELCLDELALIAGGSTTVEAESRGGKYIISSN